MNLASLLAQAGTAERPPQVVPTTTSDAQRMQSFYASHFQPDVADAPVVNQGVPQGGVPTDAAAADARMIASLGGGAAVTGPPATIEPAAGQPGAEGVEPAVPPQQAVMQMGARIGERPQASLQAIGAYLRMFSDRLQQTGEKELPLNTYGLIAGPNDSAIARRSFDKFKEIREQYPLSGKRPEERWDFDPIRGTSMSEADRNRLENAVGWYDQSAIDKKRGFFSVESFFAFPEAWAGMIMGMAEFGHALVTDPIGTGIAFGKGQLNLLDKGLKDITSGDHPVRGLLRLGLGTGFGNPMWALAGQVGEQIRETAVDKGQWSAAAGQALGVAHAGRITGGVAGFAKGVVGNAFRAGTPFIHPKTGQPVPRSEAKQVTDVIEVKYNPKTKTYEMVDEVVSEPPIGQPGSKYWGATPTFRSRQEKAPTGHEKVLDIMEQQTRQPGTVVAPYQMDPMVPKVPGETGSVFKMGYGILSEFPLVSRATRREAEKRREAGRQVLAQIEEAIGPPASPSEGVGILRQAEAAQMAQAESSARGAIPAAETVTSPTEALAPVGAETAGRQAIEQMPQELAAQVGAITGPTPYQMGMDVAGQLSTKVQTARDVVATGQAEVDALAPTGTRTVLAAPQASPEGQITPPVDAKGKPQPEGVFSGDFRSDLPPNMWMRHYFNPDARNGEGRYEYELVDAATYRQGVEMETVWPVDFSLVKQNPEVMAVLRGLADKNQRGLLRGSERRVWNLLTGLFRIQPRQVAEQRALGTEWKKRKDPDVEATGEMQPLGLGDILPPESQVIPVSLSEAAQVKSILGQLAYAKSAEVGTREQIGQHTGMIVPEARAAQAMYKEIKKAVDTAIENYSAEEPALKQATEKIRLGTIDKYDAIAEQTAVHGRGPAEGVAIAKKILSKEGAHLTELDQILTRNPAMREPIVQALTRQVLEQAQQGNDVWTGITPDVKARLMPHPAEQAALEAKIAQATGVSSFLKQPEAAKLYQEMMKPNADEAVRRFVRTLPKASSLAMRGFLGELFSLDTQGNLIGYNAQAVAKFRALKPATQELLVRGPKKLAQINDALDAIDRWNKVKGRTPQITESIFDTPTAVAQMSRTLPREMQLRLGRAWLTFFSNKFESVEQLSDLKALWKIWDGFTMSDKIQLFGDRKIVNELDSTINYTTNLTPENLVIDPEFSNRMHRAGMAMETVNKSIVGVGAGVGFLFGGGLGAVAGAVGLPAAVGLLGYAINNPQMATIIRKYLQSTEPYKSATEKFEQDMKQFALTQRRADGGYGLPPVEPPSGGGWGPRIKKALMWLWEPEANWFGFKRAAPYLGAVDAVEREEFGKGYTGSPSYYERQMTSGTP